MKMEKIMLEDYIILCIENKRYGLSMMLEIRTYICGNMEVFIYQETG